MVHVLVNPLKSQSGGGGSKRNRQANQVRLIVDDLVAQGEHVIVLGDLNERQPAQDQPPTNLKTLFEPTGPLVSCYDLDTFDVGSRLGTFDSCAIRERLDYILLSNRLRTAFVEGHVFRKGIWGSRATRPDKWATYSVMETSVHQASDHSAVAIHLDLSSNGRDRVLATSRMLMAI